MLNYLKLTYSLIVFLIYESKFLYILWFMNLLNLDQPLYLLMNGMQSRVGSNLLEFIIFDHQLIINV
ncbi:hypothetical protein Ahy_B03g062233 isoform C [Arachis hypogaea]|uniref:Uncharacterized protein n=1 Tax=Arachis hypogaea TaxID=3818 RepID=A0A444ZTK4_ARAHY|nr:hypothetical protein Ahy_B03g062233 isoform C [Arachis hypogaea]